MPITCRTFAPTFFDVLRFTVTNNCGRPIYGPNSTWVVDEPISVQVTRNMNEPDSPTLSRPSGRICRSRSVTPQIQNYTLAIGLCSVDPAMMVALNEANSPVHDYLYNIVGWDETTRASRRNVAVEGWMAPDDSSADSCEVQSSDQQDLVGEGTWGYLGFYNVSAFQESGDYTYGSELSPFQIQATANVSNSWGIGPYDVQLNPGAPPRAGKWITPVARDSGKRATLVDVAPPEPTCGPRPLSNPAAPQVFIQPGDNGLELCVQVLADGGEWVVDFGDGSPTQQFNAAEEVCHQYTEEGCVNIGVWAANNNQLYRGEHWCLPQTLALTVEPSSGAVPLEVVGSITGASGMNQPRIDWGD